jgi:hypothetical protein
MTGYIVNNVKYVAFSAAVAAAKLAGANVIDGQNGIVRWSPPAPVSKARMDRYAHRKAAYEAQCRAGAR